MTAAREAVSPQRICMALVLTGGVSLAVWMGGVAAEVERAVEGDSLYGQLCGLTATTLTVDVIGGSSAGGINGAMLGLALARGSDTSTVRDVWVRAAALGELLRDPSAERRIASFLRGDEYFLPRLREVFAALYRDGRQPAEAPLEVLLTGTLLDGVTMQVRDDFGSMFTDSNHRAILRFRCDPYSGIDDFADPSIVDKLAVAARATSSFPGAFEPTLCPVGTAIDGVDLAGHANFPSTGYVIDGGVLMNKPLSPVLDAVLARQHRPQDRRVIAYVQPAVDQEAAFGVDGLPGLGRVMHAGWFALPHSESLTRELGELRAHNESVGECGSRIDLLHISAEAPNALDARSSPQQKLAGLQLQHFGGFYRSAWRANDWMWGRLDAISRLTQLLLAPQRLRECAIADACFDDRLLGFVAAQCDGALDDEVRAEVRSLCDTARPVPDELPHLVRAVTRAMQLGAAAEELPNVARCLARDQRAGHRPSPSAHTLLRMDPDRLDPAATLAAFSACRVGEERLADDRGSAAFERIVDRVLQLALLATHRDGHHTIRPRAILGLPDSPVSPLWRAVQANARHRTWALVLLAGLLVTGGVLVVTSAWPVSARVSAVTVGIVVATLGALGAAVLARRIRAMLLASLVSLVIVVVLSFVGPWAWRAWLLAAVALDVGLSLRRRLSPG